jgi:regulator of replication initiation timing
MQGIIPEDIIVIDVDKIDFSDNEAVKRLVLQLFSTIEQLAQVIQDLRTENQRLKDEINRLKGEKGRPRILPNIPDYQSKCQKRSLRRGIGIARNRRSK